MDQTLCDPAVTSFVLDGTRYGPEQFNDDVVRNAPYVVVMPEDLQQGTVRGFSTRDAMESWLRAGPHRADYERVSGLGQRALAARATTDEELVREVQAYEGMEATQAMYRALGRHGVPASRIHALLDTYNPLLGPPGNTAWLYGLAGYGGRVCDLSAGWYWNLRFRDFDDRTSSIKVDSYTALFDSEWWDVASKQLHTKSNIAHLGAAPYWFNNLASSAIVG